MGRETWRAVEETKMRVAGALKSRIRLILMPSRTGPNTKREHDATLRPTRSYSNETRVRVNAYYLDFNNNAIIIKLGIETNYILKLPILLELISYLLIKVYIIAFTTILTKTLNFFYTYTSIYYTPLRLKLRVLLANTNLFYLI
ncbi:hypothetical protein JOL62DRAFT_560589 [Phyllosticta paracitricarpa]|uniref:Uncharacterized protein n=1 Tax=Phyllosticta paracitricarpa TaxID=2016321 RepID=A0ABR1MU28_9PEZI